MSAPLSLQNIHELLAKLAWDFSPEQLDHLFKCFNDSWQHANKKQREKLLELIRRLAEDDKEGVMASKVCHFGSDKMSARPSYEENIGSAALRSRLVHLMNYEQFTNWQLTSNL